MFSHPPTLHIRHPSSTTTEFTVTTRPPPSLRRTLTTTLLTLLRLLTLSTTTILLLSQHSRLPPALHALQLPPLPPLDPRLLYPLAALAVYLTLQRGYIEESLLVIRSLGVQTSTTAGTWVGQGCRTRFIPTEKVRDVFVNEGFWGLQVKFYLAVVAEGEGGLVVVFPTLLPNRVICEQVWRGARRCLYQPKAGKEAVSVPAPVTLNGTA